MKAVNLRPLALFSLLFFLFSIMVSVDLWWKLPVAGAFSFLSVLLFFVSHKLGGNKYIRSAAIVILAAAASFAFTHTFIDRPMQKCESLSGEHYVSGKITDVVWAKSYNCGYVAELYEMDGEDISLKVSLRGGQVLQRGDTFEAQVELSPLTSDEYSINRRYYISVGARMAAEAINMKYTGEDKDFTDRLYEINEALSARFVLLMGEENGGFAASMLLGNRAYLSEELDAAVKGLGLAHVIALSGMHLTVLCAMLSLVLSKFGAKASKLCAIPIVMAYILLTGFFASIVRAGIMLVFYNLISFSGRATDSPTNLGISALMITALDPASVCDIGFHLSVFSMLGVFAALKFMDGDKLEYDSPKIKTLKLVAMPFVMTFFATVSTMPAVIFYFGYITPAALIVSAPFSSLGDIVLWSTPFALAFGGIPFLGDVICNLCAFPCTLFHKAAIFLGSSNKLFLRIDEPIQILLAVLFAVCFMMIFVMDEKKVRRWVGIISAVLLCAFLSVTAVYAYIEYNSVILSTVEVKSGEGFVVSGRDKSVAVDISKGTANVYSRLAAKSAELGIDELDMLFIADPHSSHAKYLSVLTETVDIDAIYMPDIEDSRYVAELIEYDCVIVYYNCGYRTENEMFSVETYEDVYLSRSTVPIVRFKVETEEKSLFYIGSACDEAGLSPEKCDYLWLGGYGPKNKSAVSFAVGDMNVMVSEKTEEFYPYIPTENTNSIIVLSSPVDDDG